MKTIKPGWVSLLIKCPPLAYKNVKILRLIAGLITSSRPAIVCFTHPTPSVISAGFVDLTEQQIVWVTQLSTSA